MNATATAEQNGTETQNAATQATATPAPVRRLRVTRTPATQQSPSPSQTTAREPGGDDAEAYDGPTRSRSAALTFAPPALDCASPEELNEFARTLRQLADYASSLSQARSHLRYGQKELARQSAERAGYNHRRLPNWARYA